MVISELEYHLALLFCIEDQLNSRMKRDLEIIIPDVLPEYGGSVKRMKITPAHLYIHFTAGADHSPKWVAENIIRMASTRLIRLHKNLKGFDLIFKEDIYLKSGAKPTKKQLNDFAFLVTAGI